MTVSGGTAGSPVTLVPIGTIVSGAKIDNGKTIVISGLTAASQALVSAGAGADANNYRTINYTHPTSATAPYSLTQLTSSTNANGYGNSTTGKTLRISGISSGNILPQSDTNGTVDNGKIIRFTGGSGDVAFAQISPAGSIETKSDSNAIQSPNFTVDFDGNVTASNIGITGGAFTGGSIDLGGGTFTVDNSGSVSASSISIYDGFINLGGEFVAYTTGEVTASNLTITGGGINIGPNNFVVDGSGNMTAVGPILDNLVINPNGEPALLVSANTAEGDFAVPTNNRIDMGHWAAGSPGTFTPRLRVNGSGNVQASGSITPNENLSDINYKKNIETYTIDPRAIDKLGIYSFEWDNDKIKSMGYLGGGEGRKISVIAQEVAEHLPIAYVASSDEMMASFSLHHLVFALISSSQDLSRRLEEAERRIAELEG